MSLKEKFSNQIIMIDSNSKKNDQRNLGDKFSRPRKDGIKFQTVRYSLEIEILSSSFPRLTFKSKVKPWDEKIRPDTIFYTRIAGLNDV